MECAAADVQSLNMASDSTVLARNWGRRGCFCFSVDCPRCSFPSGGLSVFFIRNTELGSFPVFFHGLPNHVKV